MTRLELSLSFLCAVVALGVHQSGSSAAEASPQPAASAVAPKPLEADQSLLVWTGKPDAAMGGGVEAAKAMVASVTRFIGSDEVEHSSRPGLFVAVGSELYQWTTKVRTLKPSRCEGQANPYHVRTLEEASLVSVANGQRLTVVGYYRAEVEDTPYLEQHTPIAVFGNTLFVRSDREFYECGVHPQYGSKFSVFRLKSGSVRRTNIDELIPAASARMGEAEAKLREGRLNEGDLEISMIFPEFGAKGVQWTAQYTAAVPWAMSDGLWSGYTRSERLALSPKAKANSTPTAIPDALLRYLRAHPDVLVYGFSIGKGIVPPDPGSPPPAAASSSK